MRTASLVAAVALLASTAPVLAFGNSHSNSNAGALSASQAGAQSFSGSSSIANGGRSTSNAVGLGGTGLGGSSRTAVNTDIISQAPSNGVFNGGTVVGTVSYGGAANSCGVGGSLGVGVGLVGVSGSLATESSDCTHRAWTILLSEQAAQFNNPVYLQWARGVECSNPDLARVAPPGMCSPPVTVSYAQAAPASYAPLPVSDQTAQICAQWHDRVAWDVSHGFQPLTVPEQCRD